jgi:hypothetical protein
MRAVSSTSTFPSIRRATSSGSGRSIRSPSRISTTRPSGVSDTRVAARSPTSSSSTSSASDSTPPAARRALPTKRSTIFRTRSCSSSSCSPVISRRVAAASRDASACSAVSWNRGSFSSRFSPTVVSVAVQPWAVQRPSTVRSPPSPLCVEEKVSRRPEGFASYTFSSTMVRSTDLGPTLALMVNSSRATSTRRPPRVTTSTEERAKPAFLPSRYTPNHSGCGGRGRSSTVGAAGRAAALLAALDGRARPAARARAAATARARIGLGFMELRVDISERRSTSTKNSPSAYAAPRIRA